jgi:hypothetical protein
MESFEHMSECPATPPELSSLTRRVRLGGDAAIAEAIELLPLLPPGPETAALLTELPDTHDRLLQSLVLQAWDRHLSWAQAMVYGAAQPFACSDDTERNNLETVRQALGLSAQGAKNVQAVSRRLFTLFASTLGLLQRGHISRGHVWGLIEMTADLDDHEAGLIEDSVISEAPGQTIAEFRRALDRARLTVCPETAQQRHDGKVARRQVARWRDRDGMGRMLAELPPEDIAAAWEALCRRADEIAQPDDPRGRSARLADALVESITGVPAANDPRRRPDTPTTYDDDPFLPASAQPSETDEPVEPDVPDVPVEVTLPRREWSPKPADPELADPAEQSSRQTARREQPAAPEPAAPAEPAPQQRPTPKDAAPPTLAEAPPAPEDVAPFTPPACVATQEDVALPASERGPAQSPAPASMAGPPSAGGVPGDEVEIHVVVTVAQMRGQPEQTAAPPADPGADLGTDPDTNSVVVPLAPRRIRRALNRRGRRLNSTLWAVIGLDSLLGDADVPGEISTFGAVPASVIRRMAQGRVILRRLVVDDHGRLIDAEHTITLPAGSTIDPALIKALLTAPYRMHPLDYGSTVYRLPADLDRHVVLRDRTCTVPGCGQPALRCDGEHAIPWPDGPTSETNCGAMCRWHHRLKTHAGWTVERLADGSVMWSSPEGLSRRRRAFDYLRYIS